LSRQRSAWEPFDDSVVDALIVAQGAKNVAMHRRNVSDGVLVALVSEDPTGWHLSVAHNRRTKGGVFEPGRYPNWDELADARYALLPDELDFVMHLPPSGEYVALHDTTFHLHEHPARTP
jgi:hypothetical protein